MRASKAENTRDDRRHVSKRNAVATVIERGAKTSIEDEVTADEVVRQLKWNKDRSEPMKIDDNEFG